MHNEYNSKYGIGFSPMNPIIEINLESLVNRVSALNGVEIVDKEESLYVIIYLKDYDAEVKIKYDGTIVIYFKSLDLNGMLLMSQDLIRFLRHNGIITFEIRDKVQFIYHGSNHKINDVINYVFNYTKKLFGNDLNHNIYQFKGCLIISGIPTYY